MEKKEEKMAHNGIEKTTFIVGLLVLIALISFLGYQMSQDNNRPPELKVTTSHQPQMEHYSFKVDVENLGDQTAEAAQIKLELYQEGQIKGDGVVEFRYVPSKSKETGWIVFHTERKSGDSLVISLMTYAKP